MRMAGINGKKEHADTTPTPDLSSREDQKVILIAYLSEAMHRVHRPLDLTRMNLQIITDQVNTGEFEPEEIRMGLQIQINNIGKMTKAEIIFIVFIVLRFYTLPLFFLSE